MFFFVCIFTNDWRYDVSLAVFLVNSWSDWVSCFWFFSRLYLGVPTLGQLVDKLVENNILLIFAVTDQSEAELDVEKRVRDFLSCLFMLGHNEANKRHVFFCVWGTREDWRKIYRCVNIPHESLVYSVLFTTCSNTVLITFTQTDLSWHKYFMCSEISISLSPHLEFCGSSPGVCSWCL